MQLHLLPSLGLLPHLPELLGPEDEFAATREVSSAVVAGICRHGYMPMGLLVGGNEILLIKCHTRRCVLDLCGLHVPKNTRRYARGLRLAIDRDPPATLAEIDRYHAESWLTPRLRAAFLDLVQPTLPGRDGAAGRAVRTVAAPAVQVHTIELVDEAGSPVAWEVGYAAGRVYTSLTGSHRRNGSGWVQMVALGRLLFEAGFAFWDLGMEMPYKTRLGCRLVERERFLQLYREAAGQAGTPLPTGICDRPASELVRAAREQGGPTRR